MRSTTLRGPSSRRLRAYSTCWVPMSRPGSTRCPNPPTPTGTNDPPPHSSLLSHPPTPPRPIQRTKYGGQCHAQFALCDGNVPALLDTHRGTDLRRLPPNSHHLATCRRNQAAQPPGPNTCRGSHLLHMRPLRTPHLRRMRLPRLPLHVSKDEAQQEPRGYRTRPHLPRPFVRLGPTTTGSSPGRLEMRPRSRRHHLIPTLHTHAEHRKPLRWMRNTCTMSSYTTYVHTQAGLMAAGIFSLEPDRRRVRGSWPSC